MSWTDKRSVEHIKLLRDIFSVRTFFETGTYMGINARLHKNNFETVITCEKYKKYLDQAREKLRQHKNVICLLGKSSDWLRDFVRAYKKDKRKDYIIFYLDAHFYDPEDKSWVILEELKALKGFKKAIVIIHDFDNNLGHITYDGQPLDIDLIGKDLMKVNKKFKLYTNELSSCNIVTPISNDLFSVGLEDDKDTLGNLEYAWSKPEKTYRGILYALPKEVQINGLKPFKHP